MRSKTIRSVIWGWFALTSVAAACSLVIGVDYKIACVLYSCALTLTGYAYYISQMFPETGEAYIKPHPLTWFAFAIFTGVGAAIQYVEGTGLIGSACLGLTAIGCLVISVISFRRFQWRYNKMSIALVALAAVLFGMSLFVRRYHGLATWAAILATASDLFSYYPMLEKSWKQPHEESIRNLAFNSVKCIPQILAEPFPLTIATSLYLWMLTIVNGGFAIFLWWRRKWVPRPTGAV